MPKTLDLCGGWGPLFALYITYIHIYIYMLIYIYRDRDTGKAGADRFEVPLLLHRHDGLGHADRRGRCLQSMSSPAKDPKPQVPLGFRS